MQFHLYRIYWYVMTKILKLHLCEDCFCVTKYLHEGADYGYPTNNWFCENCATARGERQHERNFTNYWEG